MTGWLLDTNVVSEIRRPSPEPKVLAFVAAQPLSTLFASTVLFAEIRFGIETLDDLGRRAELHDWQPDLFIAATAMQHGLTVVSRDTNDYRRAGVPVLNPWTDPFPTG